MYTVVQICIFGGISLILSNIAGQQYNEQTEEGRGFNNINTNQVSKHVTTYKVRDCKSCPASLFICNVTINSRFVFQNLLRIVLLECF